MSITNKAQEDKSFCNMGVGNIVPTWWYKAIRAAGDKPDLVAITLLSELWFLYRKRAVEECDYGYDYFERKFNFSRAQLQDATRRLHDNGVIQRSFRSIKINRGLYPNVLHIKLDVNKLIQLRTEHDESFSDSDDGGVSSTCMFGNSSPVCDGISEEHIRKEETAIRKSRSSESNFCNFDFSYFHPLSDEDVLLLQSKSQRDFSKRAINEIIQSLGRKYPEHRFASKRAFLGYMTKALKHEMRDAVKVSNESFRINANYEISAAEKYLQIVEDSREVSEMARLRKKIAGVLEAESAYMFLRAFRRVRLEDNQAILVLTRENELTELEEQRVFAEVRCVYGNHYEVSISVDEAASGWQQEQRLNSGELANADSASTDKTAGGRGLADKKVDQNNNKIESANFTDDAWGKVRKKLIAAIGRDGVVIDKAWISYLRHRVDEESRVIYLNSTNRFVMDWIRDRYLETIEKISSILNFQVEWFCGQERL